MQILLFSCKQETAIEVRETDFLNKAEVTVHGVPVSAQLPFEIHGMVHIDSLNIVVAEGPGGYVFVYSDSWQLLDVFSGQGRARYEFLQSPSMNRSQVFKGADGHILLPLSDPRARLIKLMDITESLVRSGAVDVVVVDSVAALIPRSELEGEIGDSVVGVLARLMSQAMRRLAGAISKNNCTVIFINQLRQKIGVMYGNPETTPGGLALKYYASVRIDVRRIETLKVNGELIGNHTRAKVVKNKVAPPFKEAEFDIMYGEGISRVGEIVDLGVKLDIIDKAGAWFTVRDQRIQGRDAVKQYLLDNPEVSESIEQEIRDNAWKLMSPQARRAAQATGRSSESSVDISAADFEEG